MGDRHTIDLDPYKDWIIDLFQSNHTLIEISARLLKVHNVTCTDHTIQQQLNSWKIAKQVRTDYCLNLKKWVTALFYECCLNDKNILHILSAEGWTISAWGLIQTHQKLGLIWRFSVFNQEEADAELARVVSQELNTEMIDEYGWELLYTHFCMKGHLAAQYVHW